MKIPLMVSGRRLTAKLFRKTTQRKRHEPLELCFSRSSACVGWFSTAVHLVQHMESPRGLQSTGRKPLVTGINELKRKARLQRKMRQEVREFVLKPPENGLLVKSLVLVAHEVYTARKELYGCALRVLKSIPIHTCRLCGEVHIGSSPHQIRTCNIAGSHPTKKHIWGQGGIDHVLPAVESFHLYDRLGRAVSHEEQLQVDRIPAVVELCVQAGVDIPEYPTKRRVYPVYNIAGKMVDFERKFPRDYSSGKEIQPYGFWETRKTSRENDLQSFSSNCDAHEIAEKGMKAWEKVRWGIEKLMQKYAVQTCGYCPEVQVGPKGHRARICRAHKHQMRDGQHAWQEATVDDLMPPVHVWHVPDPHDGQPLVDELRRYYGRLPAVVELFAQAGAQAGKEYAGSMREDAVIPRLDEEKWAV